MAGAIPKQTQEDIVPPAPIAVGYRLAGVLLAAPVAVVVQTILAGPFALDIAMPSSLGSSVLEPLSPLTTAVVTLALSLVSWASIRLLQQGLGLERGRRIWMSIAFAVLAVSILSLATFDISTGARWGLVVLHSAVAVVLIPTMAARGTPGIHPTTSLPEPASPGDVGETAHDPAHGAAHNPAGGSTGEPAHEPVSEPTRAHH